MKLESLISNGNRREHGSAIIVILLVMGLALVLMIANAKAVAQLGRQLRALETRQQKHWNSSSSPANRPK
jgi:hypothetical protein